MTVPEENRAKTDSTDEVLDDRRGRPGGQGHDEDAGRPPGATGRTLREALEEAHVRPDDYDEK
ncbi:hypothetical protein [Streptomyces sp. DH24]|uniref:hypothetical protein n=1 Tax=Streptomyces sp. DH24 TaxID=3040123 RepID=UPI00244225E5|nr:hypothetical protein [Streptomyces sp. DH24]MDG9719525.1 hypothetical protein [Streptomyces sp. DH24]